MQIRAAACALFLSAFAAAAPAAAQRPEPQPGETAQTPRMEHGEEWYRSRLVELAEVLGGSHYLRILCEGRGDQRWRDYMRGVIEREPEYNMILVEAFNRGYRNEEARFPVCDANTRQMEAELRARGVRVAQALSARNQ